MPRSTSVIFKFKGTIEDLTFVDSKAYDPHFRRRKGSVTPVVLTGVMKENETRLPRCNDMARQLFQPLKSEPHDGQLWSRILHQFYKDLADKGTICLTSFVGEELNKPRKADDVLAGYDLSVTKEQEHLQLSVRLHEHPFIKDKSPRKGYRLRFVVIFPDFEGMTFCKEVIESDMQSYKAAPGKIELSIPMPSEETPYMVCFSLRTYVNNEETWLMKEAFMRVVAAE